MTALGTDWFSMDFVAMATGYDHKVTLKGKIIHNQLIWIASCITMVFITSVQYIQPFRGLACHVTNLYKVSGRSIECSYYSLERAVQLGCNIIIGKCRAIMGLLNHE